MHHGPPPDPGRSPQGTPDELTTLVAKVNAATMAGDLDQTIDGLRQLLVRMPTHTRFLPMLVTALNNRGSRRQRAGDPAEALLDYQASLALMPDHPLARFNAALCRHALGAHEAALALMQAQVQAHPGDAEARLQLAQWYLPNNPDAARAELDALLAEPALRAQVSPRALAKTCAQADLGASCIDAFDKVEGDDALRLGLDLAETLSNGGDIDAATALYARCGERAARGRIAPGLIADLGQQLSIPPIAASIAQIEQIRAGLVRGLDWLEQRWQPDYLHQCERSLSQLAWGNFYPAYHGEDERPFQTRYAGLLERAVQALVPALREPPEPIRGRIALVSSFFRDCTVGAYFGGWVRWLRAAGFEVHLHQVGPQRDAQTERLAAEANQFHFHLGSIDAIAAAVRAGRPQALIFPELGMDRRMLPLAACRLAPIQLAGWGHPVTSGLGTLDGWFSCAGMEPPDAANHYREPLLPLPGLGVDYRRPPAPPALSRAALGLPDDAVLVLVPQSLFKLHPDNDHLLAALAAARQRVRLLLFEGEHWQWRRQLMQRLRPVFSAFGADADRATVWSPLVGRERYLQINAACDFMLDSLHWSGGNTTLDALCSGLPVLTTSGRFMRGRQSAWMLQRLGLPSLVCSDAAGLLARAIELADAGDERAALRRTIVERLDPLFDAAPQREAFLRHLRHFCPSG